jgi:hypothetical protein
MGLLTALKGIWEIRRMKKALKDRNSKQVVSMSAEEWLDMALCARKYYGPKTGIVFATEAYKQSVETTVTRLWSAFWLMSWHRDIGEASEYNPLCKQAHMKKSGTYYLDVLDMLASRMLPHDAQSAMYKKLAAYAEKAGAPAAARLYAAHA